MSTFFGGEQLVEVKDLSAIAENTPGIKYTVPSGRYAEVEVLYFSSLGDWRISYTVGTRDLENPVTNELPDASDNPIFLNSGDQIEHTFSGLSTYKFLIKEYLKP